MSDMTGSHSTKQPGTKQYDTLHTFGPNSKGIDPATATGLTPMVSQFLEVKQQYPGVILFYRMGDFYETFFEDALISARVLEITLTGRDAGPLGKIPMAGVPVKAVDNYTSRLLANNLKVAICEQMEDPSAAKGLVKRQVVRVLSSGTITEQSLLKAEENNYLCAITEKQNLWGLAYCDVTTGEFSVTELSYPQLLSELDRIRPVELLVSGRVQKATIENPFATEVASAPKEILDQYPCTPVSAEATNTTRTSDILKSLFKVTQLSGFGLEDWPLAKQAAGIIAHTLQEQFIDSLPTFDTIRPYHLTQTVTMNTVARRNLELLATVRNNQYEGSLLWVLNKTATSMGARLLRQWISQPLTHLPEIQSRLDGVDELVNAAFVREQLRQLLPQVYDMERLSTKVANLTAQPRDLIALKQSVAQLPSIASLLKPFHSLYLLRMQEFPQELFKAMALIDQAIDDSPGISLKEGNIIKPGFHQELDQIRHLLATQQDWLKNYEETEKNATGIKTLKVSFNSAFGYYIEISRANSHLAPAHYHRKQTLTQAERYTTDELKAHETQVLDAQGRQFDLEYQLYIELRQQLQAYANILKDCAHRVACLDVLQSLATVAVEQHYVKPIVEEASTSTELNLQNARHPVVEKILPLGRFVPNPCVLSADPQQENTPALQIITGPNMAGKSTYMRQVALCVLMAQMGSFVPASYARLGIVDSLYTRVGAVDDLASGQSTFMVEMNETSQILNGATRHSLVLLDEVGRGTSTYDGVAIAWSVAEFLVNQIGCRTLFATHYHELNTLEATHPKIQNVRVCVSEQQDSIEFLHTVEPGTAQKSYGIQVAKMAGLPNEVIQKASTILNHFQKKERASVSSKKEPGSLDPEAAKNETPQLSLF